jgi:hypothetical protein
MLYLLKQTSTSFSFERLNYGVFWQSVANAIRPHNRSLHISSQDDFFNAFAAENWKLPVVLLVDELDELDLA